MNHSPNNSATDREAFMLQDMQVDARSGTLAGPGASLRLEPRVMAVLVTLARHPGEVVSREALLAEIWPGSSVYDDALTQCVYQLRQQLVLAGGKDSYRELVSTVPKRGYLLKGEVRPTPERTPAPKVKAPESVLAPEPEAIAQASSGRSVPRRVMLPTLTILLMLAGLSAWLIWRPHPDSQVAPQEVATRGSRHSIAVLPFLPLLEEQSDPALQQGMADTLITRLSVLPQTVVRPISSVRHFDDPRRDALAAGKLLAVETVVDGSIQQSDESVRITVRLLRVSDGAALWADTFEEPFSNIFAMQDAISTRIAAAMAIELVPVAGSDPGTGTRSTQAYTAYLKGRLHLSRLTRVDLLAAVELFEQAVTIDPGYGLAWLGLANAHFRIPLGSEGPPLEHYPKARQAALRALEIDPNLAEGHAFLGWVAHWHDWDWSASEAHFLRALELDPNNTEAHLGYAHLLSTLGLHEQALAAVQRARESSPLYLAAAALEGGFLLRAGQAQKAADSLEQAITLDPDFWFAHMILAGAYQALGQLEDALREVEIARRLNGDATWAMVNQIRMLVGADRRSEAQAILDQLLERSRERYVPPYDLALAHYTLGDPETALQWLLRGRELREPKMVFLHDRHDWPQLEERPEFVELLRSMNFPPPE